MHGRGGHVWHGGCVVGDMRGGGMHGDGICLAGGHVWQGACMVARAVHGTGGHVWQQVSVCPQEGEGAGETATTADGTHPTGMHSCLCYFPE